MAITGAIADWSRGELPEEWDVFANSENYGDEFLQRKIDSVVTMLFGEVIDEAAQAALGTRVLDYAGKLVALELINPGISYWSKQALSLGARGTNESKVYKDRAEDLRELRKLLLEQTRNMQAEVWPELPNRTVQIVPVGPRVRQVIGAVTPDPDDFERPFLLPEEVTEGTGTL